MDRQLNLSVAQVLRCFVLASLPAVVAGCWNTGYFLLAAINSPEAALIRYDIAPVRWLIAQVPVGSAAPGVSVSLALGGLLLALKLAVTLPLCAALELVGALLRRRAVDPGWFFSAWFLAVLVPASTAPLALGLATAFAYVFGQLAFGGTGRYPVSPALFGALFLQFSYPLFGQMPLPVTGLELTSAWQLAAQSGNAGATLTFNALLLGQAYTGHATASLLAVAAGGLWLLILRLLSWRLVLGTLIGLFAGAVLLGDPGLPGYWHLALGQLAFGMVFIAADPTTGALTRAGRWFHGLLLGVLTVTIRMLDPTHPEATLFALLLAGLAVPLADYVNLAIYRQRRRLSGARS